MGKQNENPHYIRDFWHYLKPYKKPLRLVYILYFVNALMNLLPAYSVRFYIDLVLMGNDVTLLGRTIQGLPDSMGTDRKIFLSLFYLAGVVILILMANTIGVIMWRRGTWARERVMYDMKIKIHNHINKLSLGYMNSNRVGDIMTKAVGDVEMVSQLLRNSFNLTYNFVQLLLAPFLMLTLSPALFIIAIIPSPLIIIAFYNIKMQLKPLYQEVRKTQSDINSHIQESISGIREVKAFNMEDKSESRYDSINRDFFNIQNRIMKVFSFNHQLQYGSKDLGIVLIAIVGGILIFTGSTRVSVGVISSFIALSGFLYNPVSSFLGFYDVIQKGMVSLERIVGFLREKEDVKDRDGAVPLTGNMIDGRVDFKDVAFSYDKGKNILESITFSAEPGQKIAIVGPSGSGKSTLISLLMRFYNVDSGSILLDGRNLMDYTQRSVRVNMGAVFQDTFLFFGTVKDNFSFVRPKATMGEIAEACKMANVYDDIMALPRGFDTMVGERGVKLSGGQKQRISIARVFLKDPKIVILDEATSAVDTVTENLIKSSIDAMLKGRTAFIIAHRLSTIRQCDKILVIDNRTIAESGTHEELLAKRGLYYELNLRDQRQ